METVRDFILGGSKITADGDCRHEIKRQLLLERKAMKKLDSILKSRDITLPTKVHLVKGMVFPVVMYKCECWTIKKAEHWRIDAFESWWWCCSDAQLCQTLCNPMNCNTPGLAVPHHLLKFAQVHVHCIGDTYQPHHPPKPSSPSPQFPPVSGTSPVSQLFISDDQNTAVSASASVLPMSIQDWFPSRLTALVSLQSKGLSGVFSSTIVQRHQFFGILPSIWSKSHNCTWWPLGRP